MQALHSVDRLRVSIVVDNTVYRPGFLAEWGFAALVEAESGGRVTRLLFDTGSSSEALLHNLGMLGVEASTIDYVVLSHGHYDHTGGLRGFLERAGGKIVVAHPGVFAKKFSLKGGRLRYIGSPIALSEAESMAKVVLSRKPLEIFEGAYFLGEIPREGHPEYRDGMYVAGEEGLEEDRLLDDTALAVNVKSLGLVLLTGCGHSGVLNIVRAAQKLTGAKVFAVVGGLHLMGLAPNDVYSVFDRLDEWGVKAVAPAHCSGTVAKCQASEIRKGFLLDTGSGAQLVFAPPDL